MTSLPPPFAFFPARYRREAWAPAILAAGAFIGLEAAFHARHEVARHVLEDPFEVVWEVFYMAGCLTYLAPLALPALREEAGFLRRAFVGFGLQLVLGGAWLWLGPEGGRLEPCLSVANAVFIAAMLSRRLAWVRDSSAVAAVTALALATLASNRHDALDVAVGASLGWAAYLLSSSPALAALAPGAVQGGCLAEGAADERPVSIPDFRREQAVTSLALAAGLTAGFYYIDRAAAVRAASGAPFWAPISNLDAAIPFIAEWVWAYLLYFPLCFAPLALNAVRNEPEAFRGAARGYLIQYCTAFAVFLLWPSGVSLPLLNGGGLSEGALGLIHRLDPGFNVFPSLHSANAVFVACLVGRFVGGLPSAAVWGAASLVAVSTVLVKQHYLPDVPAGISLGALAFAAAFGERSVPGSATALRPFLRFGFAAAFAPLSAVFGSWGGIGFGAALLSCAVARLFGAAGGWGAFSAALAAVLLAAPESLAVLAAGAGLGGLAYRLAFWEQMLFLDDVEPLRRLRHQVDEALNVFLRSDKGRWDRMYAAGQWEHLHGDALAPLYESIADQLKRAVPGGGRVVDLGCGNGALIRFLRGWHRGYSGADLSEVAVTHARSRGLRADESVVVCPVEDYEDFSGHDAAVFNEVLYYLPVSDAAAAVRRAAAALKGPRAVLVVMTDNPKARAVWAELDRWRRPSERRVFRITPNDPPCEARLYSGIEGNG